MKTRYSHLTLAYRRQIERWRLMKMSATEIAERLGRRWIIPASTANGQAAMRRSQRLSRVDVTPRPVFHRFRIEVGEAVLGNCGANALHELLIIG
ncbi:helix-turn-helix domain-containing protein [Rhizobium sp. C1]|uniref:helix-turn-helix domain-containing protein n=1 Tax=Rhizobium sp. C1 TaxID=1349799 RepID=UPI003FA6976C